MTDTIRALYVDDELGLLEIAKFYLEESGEFSVTTIVRNITFLNLDQPISDIKIFQP